MDVKLTDLHHYKPTDKFDVAIFIESYCHLSNAGKVLYNISEATDKIILREYHLIPLSLLFGYFFAWVGHFIFEKNKHCY